MRGMMFAEIITGIEEHMSRMAKTKVRILTLVLLAIAALGWSVTIFAHEGEDHGEKKSPTVSTSANMIVRAARVGDLAVTIKHPPVEPDKEVTARVPVTRFNTNEPVERAKIQTTFVSSEGSALFAASATPGNIPGLYEVKLPPLHEGKYKFAALVELDGTRGTIEYGLLEVTLPPRSVMREESSWARTALVALVLIAGLASVGVLIYRAAHSIRRHRIKGEAATA